MWAGRGMYVYETCISLLISKPVKTAIAGKQHSGGKARWELLKLALLVRWMCVTTPRVRLFFPPVTHVWRGQSWSVWDMYAGLLTQGYRVPHHIVWNLTFLPPPPALCRVQWMVQTVSALGEQLAGEDVVTLCVLQRWQWFFFFFNENIKVFMVHISFFKVCIQKTRISYQAQILIFQMPSAKLISLL